MNLNLKYLFKFLVMVKNTNSITHSHVVASNFYEQEDIADPNYTNEHSKNNDFYNRKRKPAVGENEKSTKRPSYDILDLFKKLKITDINKITSFNDDIVRLGTQLLQFCDFQNIISSMDPNLRLSDCTEDELKLLCIQFPLLYPTGTCKERSDAYLNIIHMINYVLVNYLNLFFPDDNYDNYKMYQRDNSYYFSYKKINSLLFKILISRRHEIQRHLETFSKARAASMFLMKLDNMLTTKEFNLKKFYSHLTVFRKQNKREATRKFLISRAITILKEIYNDHYTSVPNGPSLLLSIISSLDTGRINIDLYLLVAYFRSMQILISSNLDDIKSQILIINSGILLDKLLTRRSEIKSCLINERNTKLKTIIRSIKTDKQAFENSKTLFFDFFYLMFYSDFRIAQEHNKAISEDKTFDKKVDLIYYGLFKEVEEIFNEVIKI